MELAMQYNLLEPVEKYVASADLVTQLAWDSAAKFERSSTLVLSMADILGLSEAALDQMFLAGSQIKV
jgi:hypothetical protein